MFKLIKIVLMVGVLAVAWWLLSPLFIDKEVDDELDPKVESAINFALEKTGEGLQKAGEKIKDTDVAEIKKKIAELKEDASTNLEDQIKSEEEMAEFAIEMSKMEDKEMSEDVMDSGEPKVLSTGEFVSVGHTGSGQVKLIDLGGDAGSVLRFENLDVSNGPDLRVYLSKNGDVTTSKNLGDFVELGQLKGNKGNQNYVIPSSINVDQYNSVVIYCKPFKVVFNTANLEKSQ